MNHISNHVGNRIRLFRKARGIPVEFLSEQIHKSKATVYKYESGEIPVDVDTLAEIAAVLKVEVAHFFDIPSYQEPDLKRSAFFDTNRLYAYYYDGRIKKLVRSLLSFHSVLDEKTYRASFFMNIKDFEKPETARYVYSGTLIPHEQVSYFILNNATLPIETFTIELMHTFRTGLVAWGLFLGLSDQPMAPMAAKILISKVPLSDTELESYPLVFTKEERQTIRDMNALILTIH